MTVHIKSNEVEWTQPMKVFVVRGLVDYEGSDLLGLYHNQADAEKRAEEARKEYHVSPDYPMYDSVTVTEMEVK